MNVLVKQYLAQIGRKGGKKSKRTLDPLTAKKMVLVREAKRAFNTYYTQCFWSYNPNSIITYQDIPWIREQLIKYGNIHTWTVAEKLCL